ncbi:calsyntenin-2 [Cricetulus griseus]|nr:calsyntenin-2 [Cricetulus griseus]
MCCGLTLGKGVRRYSTTQAPGVINKHKPWIETSYHGVITENNDTVILDPPLVALDKDAPVPFAVPVYFGY